MLSPGRCACNNYEVHQFRGSRGKVIMGQLNSISEMKITIVELSSLTVPKITRDIPCGDSSYFIGRVSVDDIDKT